MIIIHNKEYALKLIQEKLNGKNNYTYSKITSLTGYTKMQLIRFSKDIQKKEINEILKHGLSDKPSNNSASNKEIQFIKKFKIKYPYISISQFQDIYNEDIIFNSKMTDVVKNNFLKKRSYSFFQNLYKTQGWVIPDNDLINQKQLYHQKHLVIY